MILIDTPIWSYALRRNRNILNLTQSDLVEEFEAIVSRGEAALIGPVRQEVLSGFAESPAWDRLRGALRSHEDVPLTSVDFEEAARCFNRCRSRGIAGQDVDFLICAVAIARDMAVFTLDTDFDRYAEVLPVRLHRRAAGPP